MTRARAAHALLAIALVVCASCPERDEEAGRQLHRTEAAEPAADEGPGRPGAHAGKPAAGATARPAAEGDREILYWVAPMDPNYRRDRPGKSPMGMDLVPVYADEVSPEGLVEVDPVVVQNMGVRTALVRRTDLARRVRTIGSVVPAEDRLSVVNLRYSGWIERIYVEETGVRVEAGAPLFELYSPELVEAQQEYLVALRTMGRRAPLTRSARERLENLGLAPDQIAALTRRGRADGRFTVRAPSSGWVVHKDVLAGARVEAGQDVYRIAELNPIWIEADLYEFDAPWIEEGAPAWVETTFQPGRMIETSVDHVYPTLDERTRTLRVRLVIPNPDLRLKPGMFATVLIRSQAREDVLAVPSEAVIRSGARELVFVVREPGRYEARQVTTGLSGAQDLVEITRGLSAGERIVTSGQFLLDSESRLREAVQKMAPVPEDEAEEMDHAGMDHGTAAGPEREAEGEAAAAPPEPEPDAHQGHDMAPAQPEPDAHEMAPAEHGAHGP